MAKQGAKATPRLRFPEFRGDSWDRIPGGKLFDSISNRNAEAGLPILAITQEHGAIPRDLIDYHVSVTEQSIESYKVVERGDFIISLRSFQGGIEYSNYRGICSPAYVILRQTGEGSSQYFRQLFKSERFIQQITRSIEGLRDGKMISYKQFSEQLIPMPKSVEQQKIADCLTSLDELIAAQGRKVEALKAHKRGLMQQIFPREGETRPRLRFPEFRNAPEWTVGKACDIVDVLQGYGFPERMQGNKEGELPFYKVSDISACVDAGGTFLADAKNHIDASVLDELRAKPLPPGTTVFAKIGEAIRSNKRAITTRPSLVDNNAAGVKAIKGIADDYFVYYLWSQVALIEYSGGVVPAVNKSAIEQIQVCYPVIEEQKRISDGLASIDSEIALASNQLRSFRVHKQGLMQQLFPQALEG